MEILISKHASVPIIIGQVHPVTHTIGIIANSDSGTHSPQLCMHLHPHVGCWLYEYTSHKNTHTNVDFSWGKKPLSTQQFKCDRKYTYRWPNLDGFHSAAISTLCL